MEWDKSASMLLEKVPPFIQKTVKEKVELLARERGNTLVTEVEVVAAREGFMGKPGNAAAPTRAKKPPVKHEKLSILKKYEKYFDSEGNPVLHQIKTCKGDEVGCPFLIKAPKIMADKLKTRLEELKFTENLLDKVEGQILPHHTMKLSVSGCPNCCSMPQIKDFGVNAVEPVVVDEECECIECMKCVEACREDAITIENAQVTIDEEKCVHCGICAKVCPTGSIKSTEMKYRVMIGGKVGRHPKFALDLLPQADESTTQKAMDVCVDMILSSVEERRFRTLVEQLGIEEIKSRI